MKAERERRGQNKRTNEIIFLTYLLEDSKVILI